MPERGGRQSACVTLRHPAATHASASVVPSSLISYVLTPTSTPATRTNAVMSD